MADDADDEQAKKADKQARETEQALKAEAEQAEEAELQRRRQQPNRAGIRQQVFEVIVRQALAGAPWREICAGPMQVNNIDPREVEDEVVRRGGSVSMARDEDFASYSPAEIQTNEIRDSVTPFVSNLISRSLLNQEFDQAALEGAIDRIYLCHGNKKAKIVILECPLYFGVLPHLFETYRILLQQGKDSKTAIKYLRNCLRSCPSKRLWERFDKLLQELKDCDELGINFSSQVSNFLFDLRTRLGYALNCKIGSFKARLDQQVQNSLSAVLSRIRQCYTSDRERSKSEREHHNQMDEMFRRFIESYTGIAPFDYFSSAGKGDTICAWEMYWVTLHKVASQVNSELYSDNEIEDINDYMQLLQYGFAYSFMENVCFVLRHPKTELDTANRPHSQTGPAIDWGGEEKRHVWHGLVIPGYVIEKRKLLNPLLIDSIANLELRRVMIEIYGWEKYVRSFGCKLVHEDKFGKLYVRGKFARDGQQRLVQEPEMAVEVTNSTPEPDGSFKRYFLRVPPTMTTAHEAVAWTFGLTVDEYQPDKES